MKKVVVAITMLLTMIALTVAAVAAGSFSGRVTAINGERVTIGVGNQLPGWVKKGTTVSALGSAPKVVEVNGNTVVLLFPKAKEAAIKAETPLTVSQSAGDELQGC